HDLAQTASTSSNAPRVPHASPLFFFVPHAPPRFQGLELQLDEDDDKREISAAAVGGGKGRAWLPARSSTSGARARAGYRASKKRTRVRSSCWRRTACHESGQRRWSPPCRSPSSPSPAAPATTSSVRCSTSGRRSGGGGRTTTAWWSSTICRRSTGSRASPRRCPPSTTPRRWRCVDSALTILFRNSSNHHLKLSLRTCFTPAPARRGRAW
ncbi:Protein Brevis radix-like 2, partial [Dichanthelium oligosanthes]